MSGASLKVDSSERGESRPRVFNCSRSSTMRSPVKPRRARRSSCNIAKLSREGKRKNQNDRSQSPERLVHWCGSVANDVKFYRKQRCFGNFHSLFKCSLLKRVKDPLRDPLIDSEVNETVICIGAG